MGFMEIAAHTDFNQRYDAWLQLSYQPTKFCICHPTSVKKYIQKINQVGQIAYSILL